MESKKEAELRKILASTNIEDADAWVRDADTYQEPQALAEMALFLREAWRSILRKDDTTWIETSIAELESRVGRQDLYALRFLPELPEFREALKRVVASGISLQDITTISRQLQIDTLANVICLLDGGSCFEDGLESNWSLYAIDEDLEPTYSFSDMKHLMWEFDPDEERP